MAKPFDLVVSGGTLVGARGRTAADLGVRGGRVAEVGAGGALRGLGVDEVDAADRFVLPGVIDGHVHLRSPGLEHKEDWQSGTRAAVHGGVTTLLDMPNTVPPTRSLADAKAKRALAQAGAHCDFGVFGLVDRVSGASAAAELIGSGLIVGLKVFLGASTGALAPPSEDALVGALRLASAANMRTAFHAEDAAVLRDAHAAVAERADPRAHLAGRPVAAEVAAIDHAARLLSRAGAAGHILHLSSADGIDAVRRWRARGVDLTCEVTPHHLLLGEAAYDELGGLIKVNPPIRGEPHISALLAALADGTIDCVASDHAPHAPAEKSAADVRRVEAGVAGVETLLPLMLTLVDAGRLSLERLVDATSAAPARTWRLAPAKGSLEPGADADLTVVRLGSESTIGGRQLHGRHPLTPFEGFAVRAAVVATVVRGRVVVRDAVLTGEPGFGRPVSTGAQIRGR